MKFNMKMLKRYLSMTKRFFFIIIGGKRQTIDSTYLYTCLRTDVTEDTKAVELKR